jgi:AcrR family transcriptional regulator
MTEEQKAQRRWDLLDAAWRVVQRDGEEATVRKILDEAGMVAEELDRLFGSKPELLKALANEKSGETLASVAADRLPDETVRGLLVRFVVEMLSRPYRTSDMVVFRSRDTEPADRVALSEFHRLVVERFAPLVRSAQESGEMEVGWDAEALTELVDIIIEGVNRRHHTDTFATSFQRVGDTAIALVLGGVLVPEQQQRARA